MTKDEIDEFIEQLGIEELSGEIDNTGCQHPNIKTNGMATWCEDCGLSDIS